MGWTDLYHAQVNERPVCMLAVTTRSWIARLDKRRKQGNQQALSYPSELKNISLRFIIIAQVAWHRKKNLSGTRERTRVPFPPLFLSCQNNKNLWFQHLQGQRYTMCYSLHCIFRWHSGKLHLCIGHTALKHCTPMVPLNLTRRFDLWAQFPKTDAESSRSVVFYIPLAFIHPGSDQVMDYAA